MFDIAITACNKDNDDQNIPECSKDKIEKFKKEVICDESKVNQFNFQNNIVYVFDEAFCCCDHNYEVFDSQCKRIGYLDRLIGNKRINGENFDNADFIKTVWSVKWMCFIRI